MFLCSLSLSLFFFFSILVMSSGLNCFWWEISYLWLLLRFSVYLCLGRIYLRCEFLCIYLTGGVLNFLNLWTSFFLFEGRVNFGRYFAKISPNIFFALFSLLLLGLELLLCSAIWCCLTNHWGSVNCFSTFFPLSVLQFKGFLLNCLPDHWSCPLLYPIYYDIF